MDNDGCHQPRHDFGMSFWHDMSIWWLGNQRGIKPRQVSRLSPRNPLLSLKTIIPRWTLMEWMTPSHQVGFKPLLRPLKLTRPLDLTPRSTLLMSLPIRYSPMAFYFRLSIVFLTPQVLRHLLRRRDLLRPSREPSRSSPTIPYTHRTIGPVPRRRPLI